MMLDIAYQDALRCNLRVMQSQMRRFISPCWTGASPRIWRPCLRTCGSSGILRSVCRQLGRRKDAAGRQVDERSKLQPNGRAPVVPEKRLVASSKRSRSVKPDRVTIVTYCGLGKRPCGGMTKRCWTTR